MAGKAAKEAVERSAWLEREFAALAADYETRRADMTLDQRIATVGRLAQLSTAIGRSDAAAERALRAGLEADRAVLKIEAELDRDRDSGRPRKHVEGDETDMDGDPNPGGDLRTPEELRREIKGRLDLLARRVLARPVRRCPDIRGTPARRCDVDVSGGGEATPA